MRERRREGERGGERESESVCEKESGRERDGRERGSMCVGIFTLKRRRIFAAVRLLMRGEMSGEKHFAISATAARNFFSALFTLSTFTIPPSVLRPRRPSGSSGTAPVYASTTSMSTDTSIPSLFRLTILVQGIVGIGLCGRCGVGGWCVGCVGLGNKQCM